MYYAVKKGRVPGIYEDKELALQQTFQFPFNEMRTFTKKEDALEYLAETPKIFYVVKVGRVPGIYTSREELSAQVRDFPNPLVKTFKNKEKAETFFNEDVSKVVKEKEERDLLKKIRAEKNKESYQEKIEQYLQNGISLHGENICFIDIEANKGFAISLGAVIYDSKSHQIIESFSSLMRYDSFDKMDSFCEHIHHIKEEDILSAKRSDEVMKEFISLLEEYTVCDIFTWGNCDKSFLRKSLTDKTLMDKIPHIRNIQTFISCVTRDVKENKTWSLQNMKKFYGIQGEVVHDALSDAKDLVKVFQCFQDKKKIDKELVVNT